MKYQLARATRDSSGGFIKKGETFWVIAERPKRMVLAPIDGSPIAYVGTKYRTNIMPINQPLARGLAVSPDMVELLPEFADDLPQITYEDWLKTQTEAHDEHTN